MRAIRGKDTTPELTVRRLLFKLGYRYRLHVRHLPGTPDLVFEGRRKAIFVHGCFWHQHAGAGTAIPQVQTRHIGNRNLPAIPNGTQMPSLRLKGMAGDH